MREEGESHNEHNNRRYWASMAEFGGEPRESGVAAFDCMTTRYHWSPREWNGVSHLVLPCEVSTLAAAVQHLHFIMV